MKTALITGANSGVGFELTKKLLAEGWQVIALIRTNFLQDESILQAIRSKRLRIYNADISTYKSLKTSLEQIKASEKSIDVLFNNAGVSIGELRNSTQGREWHYEINTVVPYIITMELQDLLINGRDKTVINTSSNALLTVKKFHLSSLEKPDAFKKLFGPYASSKLALSLWTKAIAPDLNEEGIEIRSVCPGGNKTPLTTSDGMPLLLKLVAVFLFSHPRVGANKVFDAYSRFKGISGAFINKGQITSFKFGDQDRTLLAAVNKIYREEYLNP